MSRIYVASSWRNELQPEIVNLLRSWGHTVYDFRNPSPGDHGFSWDEIDLNWRDWTPAQLMAGLQNPIARSGFVKDMTALHASDTVVLLLPTGRSGHMEAGWAAGACKRVFVYCLPSAKVEPELMYLMFDGFADSPSSLRKMIGDPERVGDEPRTAGSITTLVNDAPTIHQAIDDFGVHQAHKMLMTRNKPHWSSCSYPDLMRRLRSEFVELQEAIESGNRKAIVGEAADVGNFAMMIADNAQRAGRPGASMLVHEEPHKDGRA